MTQDEQIQQLKEQHDKLQEGLSPSQMAIREGIIINVPEGGYDSYPRFGYQFFCFRSPEMVREMDLFIKYAKGKNILADVGAYHGIYSLVFGKLNFFSRQYAFEPFIDAFDVLLTIKSLNHDICLQSIFAGLSDKTGKIPMREEGGHFIMCEESDKDFDTACLTGDAYFSMEALLPNPPDVIKCDCEGMELMVLQGFKKTIEKNHPLIFLELHLNILPKESVAKVYDMLANWDYKILDTETESEISLQQISNKEGELRLICL